MPAVASDDALALDVLRALRDDPMYFQLRKCVADELLLPRTDKQLSASEAVCAPPLASWRAPPPTLAAVPGVS